MNIYINYNYSYVKVELYPYLNSYRGKNVDGKISNVKSQTIRVNMETIFCVGVTIFKTLESSFLN